MDKFLGLDVGARSIKVVLSSSDGEILYKNTIRHFGNVNIELAQELEKISSKFENIQVMGTGKNIKPLLAKEFIVGEITCLFEGGKSYSAKSIIEIGAENARFISNAGGDLNFAVNEDCASGTGSFFEDQMYRLGHKIEDYSSLVESATSVPRLSGRCSVFAKTDIIHRQQEGATVPDILLGLCYATARNIKSSIVNKYELATPVLLAGGVSKNAGVVRAVKEVFNLSDGELIVGDEYLGAIGAVKFAAKSLNGQNIQDCIMYIKSIQNKVSKIKSFEKLPTDIEIPQIKTKVITKKTICSLGIDVGSTSTNIVLIDGNNEIVDFQYLRTKGEPEGAVKAGLQMVKEKFADKIQIKSVGVTGSGRYLIGKLVGADSVVDEITAQAKSAVCSNPNAGTVFEIGGQDSKFIQINNGSVINFQMNKICSAGTGSFIEEQASRLGVPLEKYGDRALLAENPTDLGDRCTVFIESSIASSQGLGVPTNDILAGLCYSIVQNYLAKVVETREVSDNIVLQGGVCYNKGIVSAFKHFYGDKLIVSPYFAVSGAYGVAVIASERVGENQTKFKGFNQERKNEIQDETARADINKNIAIFEKPQKMLLEGYDGKISPKKQTIGVPFSLLVFKFFPMIKNFFETLGYNVLLSKSSDEEIIALAQKYAKAETCFPVKLIYGHMAWLKERNVDYIFMPSVHTMKHESSDIRYNYGCVYMQSAPKLVYKNMGLEKSNIKLLNPVFDLDFGAEAMAKSMIGVGVSLGKMKPICVAALAKGGMAVKKHTAMVEKAGEQILANIKQNEKVFVMVTRTYGIDDPVLNMNIPYELLKRGEKVITISHLKGHDLNLASDYPNMFWPFSQHILASAKIIAKNPNLFPIFLTNHGCAPDTMIASLFKKEMGDKPFLNIEVDEHYSKVGVITRIEAFIASVYKTEKTTHELVQNVDIKSTFNKKQRVILPNIHPYSDILAMHFNKKGYNFTPEEKLTPEAFSLGRNVSTSKEYLSFVAMVGSVLNAEKTAKEKIGYFIPQTEGSETDGVFPRVIFGNLKKKSNVEILTKTIETLPFEEDSFDEILNCILAGDILSLADSKYKKEIQKQFETGITYEKILQIASSLKLKNAKKILLVGDPYILFGKGLPNLESYETDKIKMVNMPLSEYLLFMWAKRAETESQKEAVQKVCQKIAGLNKALGENSNFHGDIQNLLKVSLDHIGKFTGGNGAYRMAKILAAKEDGVIDVASAYENTQSILNLLAGKPQKPFLMLGFEGTNNVSEKVETFIYYLLNN